MVIISDIQLPKDSDGILKVSDVSTSAQGDLSARTDPTNPSTSKFIQADSSNNLGVYLGNAEGVGANNSLNATEYPVVQVGGFDGNDFRSLKIDTEGKVDVNVRNAASIIPHSTVNSGTVDDPANSIAVGLRGRTDITLANTETFLKCDTDGHLQVDIVSGGGGGGDASEATLSALNDKVSKGADQTLSNAQQVLAYGEVISGPGAGELHPIHITQSGDVEVVIADLEVKGQDTMANSLPVVIASDQSTLNVQLNDISAGIINPINTNATRKNVYTQVLTDVDISLGGTTTSSAITAINGSSNTSITIYIHTGSGTSDSNFSYEVHKSYDGTHYFLDSNFSFSPLGADVNGNNQPARFANYTFDAQFIRVKVNNLSENNTTAINAYILERQ